MFLRGRALALISWSLYDFANTIFSAVVLTAYFPLYFTELTGANWLLGFASTVSMVAAGFAVPYLGALSDRTGKTKLYLIRSTLVCILFLAGLSATNRPSALLLFFVISAFFFHAALVFYNALLPQAAPPERQGFASGLGTGLGYLGVFLALPLAHLVDTQFGRPYVFVLAALLFLIFSLPAFIFVPERKSEKSFMGSDPNCCWGQTPLSSSLNLLRSLPRNPPLLLFFLGNFFAVDAVNSTIFWFMVYGREVFHAPQAALVKLMLAVNGTAFLYGILAGFLTDRLGSMKTFILASGVLTLTLVVLSLAPSFQVYALAASLGGAFALAGCWTAGRKAVIEFAPPEKLGQYFGLYGLTTKISVVGSLTFSICADIWGFRAALWALILPAFAGTGLLIASNLKRGFFMDHGGHWNYCRVL